MSWNGFVFNLVFDAFISSRSCLRGLRGALALLLFFCKAFRLFYFYPWSSVVRLLFHMRGPWCFIGEFYSNTTCVRFPRLCCILQYFLKCFCPVCFCRLASALALGRGFEMLYSNCCWSLRFCCCWIGYEWCCCGWKNQTLSHALKF